MMLYRLVAMYNDYLLVSEFSMVMLVQQTINSVWTCNISPQLQCGVKISYVHVVSCQSLSEEITALLASSTGYLTITCTKIES